jgi:dimethylaniline monooxygenase (N-oxide forming)
MLKTLREDGFKVTAFERRKQVGGLWAYTKDTSMTTALPCGLLAKGGIHVILC